jgi:hypothetical protein
MQSIKVQKFASTNMKKKTINPLTPDKIQNSSRLCVMIDLKKKI